VSATISHEVVDQLNWVQSLETITGLVHVRVIRGAGPTELIDSMVEEVLISLGVIAAKGLLQIRILGKIVLQVKHIRAGTALADAVVVPVLTQLLLVVVEGVLQVRILVVIEISIEHKVLRSDRAHGRNAKSSKAHVSKKTLLAAHVAIVPHELSGSEAGQEGIDTLVHIGVEGSAGLTHLTNTMTEVVVIGLLVVRAKCLLEVRVLVQVEGKVKDLGAGTALADAVVVPVLKKLLLVVVEGILEVRILVVVEVSIEDDVLQLDSRIRGNTSDHFMIFLDERKGHGFTTTTTTKER